MDDDKKASARKPPLPVDRLRAKAGMIYPLISVLVSEIERVYKVKGKWCHNFTKNMFQHVLTKLQSKRPSKKKLDTSFHNLSTLHALARAFVVVVQSVLKVEGQWSNEYNEDLIQLAIALLRTSSAPSINNNNNPLAVHVGTASNSSSSS
ncbi:hypothetical protein AAHA92_13650 [Salvia divinorum]|uniref:Uncharacterized protein n=1 Tax=Salvia divinorum TaxID=28513 RepID=A0ABD1HCA9_SALDI